MSTLLLYHTAYQEIRDPDIHYGRKNADFGQGFYTTDDREFAFRWARERKNTDIIVNSYELETDGLAVHTFSRDESWYEYISGNRSVREDHLKNVDVIIGPIANDTIYDTLGIMTSGFLDEELSLRLLQLGPEYRQIVLKTEKAASQLKWISSKKPDISLVREFQDVMKQEETEFQEMAARLISI